MYSSIKYSRVYGDRFRQTNITIIRHTNERSPEVKRSLPKSITILLPYETTTLYLKTFVWDFSAFPYKKTNKGNLRDTFDVIFNVILDT